MPCLRSSGASMTASDADCMSIVLLYACWFSLLSTGFLEMGESTAAGAARETWEEANARVEVRRWLCSPSGASSTGTTVQRHRADNPS